MMDEYQWCELTEVYGIVEAQIIKGLLESNGIPTKLQYETAALLFGIRMDGLGRVKILVPEEYLYLAAKVLKEKEEDQESL